MASQDVIELGSSDDEPEPAPKRSKPPLNAMVHIPTNLPGVTIKKSKPQKTNGQAVKLQVIKMAANKVPYKPVSIPVVTNVKPGINPMSLIKTINNPQIQIKKVQSLRGKPQAVAVKRTGNPTPRPQSNINKTPPNFNPKGKVDLNTIAKANSILKRICNSSLGPQPQSSKSVSQLPPGIIVKQVKQINNTMKANLKMPIRRLPIVMPPAKKKRPNPPPQTREVLTVELDDDDNSKPSNSPQWYVRPEDQESATSLEEKNNKEPGTANYIEITIEDSPIKPGPSKKTKEVDQGSINIEDSPYKGSGEDAQNEEAISSGDESTAGQRQKNHNSKKKLQYSKEAEIDNRGVASPSTEITLSSPNIIEIEIPPLEFEVPQINAVSREAVSPEAESNDVIEILESPAKKKKKTSTVKPIPNPEAKQISVTDISSSPTQKKSEFHPTYQSFIDLCFKLENSEDMRKIVEKKIKTYYLQVPKEYTESEEFLEMVSSKIMSMKAGPEKMYLYIKDIVDELNLQRKIAKSIAAENEKKQEKAAAEFYGEQLEADTKRKRQVRKLEKTLKKLNRAIHKLEEQEVDFDDDGDSVYILTESEDEIYPASGNDKDKPERDKQVLLQRYKERLVRVHAKLCQLSNTKMPSEPRVLIEPRPGQPAGPAKRLEKWINKRVPVGTPLPFPDFHDVLRCVRDANDEDKLGWNEVDIMEEARDLFTRCGKKLQRRRQENEWRLAASRLTADEDPAEMSQDLKKKLEENRKVSAQKEAELINKYADRQKQLQLEAVEIGDKEAEESPVESGDEVQEDERQEEKSLESTEGRKERLRRLLKERSKGATKNAKPIELDDDEEDANKEKTDNGDSEALEKGKENVDTSIKSAVDGEIPSDVAGPSNTVDASTEDKTGKDTNETGSNDHVHLLSDDSKDVGSEIDELNLLQKLHSGTDVATSTLESSDTDTPIAISDTLGSSDDIRKTGSKHSNAVVSIENSSYSESEANNDKEQEKEGQNTEEEILAEPSEGQSQDPLGITLDSDRDSPRKVHDSNDEYTEPLEDILLASSDEEDMNKEKQTKVMSIDSEDINDSCINLGDDSISIGDTVVEGTPVPKSDETSDESAQLRRITTAGNLTKPKDENTVIDVSDKLILGDVFEKSDKLQDDHLNDGPTQEGHPVDKVSTDCKIDDAVVKGFSDTKISEPDELSKHDTVLKEGNTVFDKCGEPKSDNIFLDKCAKPQENFTAGELAVECSKNSQDKSGIESGDGTKDGELESGKVVEKNTEQKTKNIDKCVEVEDKREVEKDDQSQSEATFEKSCVSIPNTKIEKSFEGSCPPQSHSTDKDESISLDNVADISQKGNEKNVTDNGDCDKPISNNEAKSEEVDSANPPEKLGKSESNNVETDAMDTS